MIYIIGVGSHAQVVYSILSQNNDNNIKFLSIGNVEIDKNNRMIYENYGGNLEDLNISSIDKFIIGIGDNNLRMEIVKKYKNLNYINAIHKNSFIANEVNIGIGNVICSGVSIQTGSIIKNHNIINTNSGIDHHNKIHNFCHIAPNCAICGNVEIFDNCFVGVGSSIIPNVKIAPFSFIKGQSLIKESTGPIPIYEPYIKKYKNSAIDAIESGWISSQGKYIKLATEKLKNLIGCDYVILMNNGTSATHCLLMSLKYKYPNLNKIYVPNNVYSAVWNSILLEYTLENIEVLNIDLETLNIIENDKYISSLEKNSCLFIVHNVGNIIDVDRIKKIRPDIVLIEDNCEGFLGKYNNKYTGSNENILCSSISFFANKIITGGECGAFLTNDQDLYRYISKISNQGNTDKRYITDVRGQNYRCNNISAALLYDQLNDIKHIIKKRENIFNNYDKMLKHEKILIPKINDNCSRSCWIYCLRIIGNESYEKINQFMKENGIDIRPFFYSIKEHKHLSSVKFFDENDENSKILSNETFMIPSSSELGFDRQQYISNKIIEYIELSRYKKYYLTFINKKYSNEQILNRIRKETSEFRYFDDVKIKNEEDLEEFLEKHKSFIRDNPHGFGLYIWKPKIIYEFLSEINYGDVIIYTDAGVHLNDGGIDRFKQYIKFLDEKDVIVFGLNDKYKARQYVKMDVIMDYYPEFNREANIYHYAGIMIIKKTEKVMNLFKDWLTLCENYQYLNSTKSIKYPENETFIAHDFDNALFNICLYKHKNYFSIYPDETLIYDSNGKQDYIKGNWETMKNYPFHNKRDFPRT